MPFSSSFDESQAYRKNGFWFSPYLHFQPEKRKKKKSAIDEIACFLKVDFKKLIEHLLQWRHTKKLKAKPNEDIQKWRGPRSLEEDEEEVVHVSFSYAELYNS